MWKKYFIEAASQLQIFPIAKKLKCWSEDQQQENMLEKQVIIP